MMPRYIRTLAFVVVMLQAAVGQAQITLDGTIRPGAPSGPLTGPNYVIPAAAGKTVGDKTLFHSFGLFNLHTINGVPERASFTGPSTIENIISRVTGGQRSVIDGLIDSRSSMQNANFFLLNPSGVLFGPNATLDVGGSFHVSTADYVRFGDDAKFFANPSGTSVLTAASPIAFGFLNSAPVRISVEGSSLRVDPGKTLSLVGGDAPFPGDITMETGLKIAGPPPLTPEFVPLPNLGAPGGTIQVVSVASAGEVILSPSLDVSLVPSLGRVQISGGALIDASGALGTGSAGGTVEIRGSQIDILADPIFGGARIDASGDALLGGASGTVRIRGRGLFADSASITANTFGDVDGALIGIDLGLQDQIVLTNGTFAATLTFGGGDAGNIVADTRAFTVSAGGLLGSASVGPGRGGDVTITAAESVSLFGGAFLSTDAGSSGDAGRLSISTSSLRMDDLATIASSNFGLRLVDGVSVPVLGGAIEIDVQTLSITGGATIRSVTGLGDAVGGNITVKATGAAVISGRGFDGSSSGIFVDSQGGPAGTIALDVATLSLTGGAVIQSGSLLAPQGGAIRIKADDSILIADGSGILSQALDREVLPVEIRAPTIEIDNGFINTSTLGSKPAGAIIVDTERLTITGGGEINSSSERFATETGRGGDITITAGDLVLISGRSPSDVPVNPFSTELRSGIFSTAAGLGPGGNIKITGTRVELRDGGIISARSTGTDTALAGNVNINAGSLFRMANSTITTESLIADGGNISITTTGSLVHLSNSQITTSVQSGIGSGGNIAIDSQLIVFDGSRISADAFGGPGGNIDITAEVYLTQNSLVTASSALSTPGTINIQASITDVSGTLARLPEAVLQAAALLRASCAARLAGGKSSSLVLAGREGLPLEPGSLLPSPLVLEGPAEFRLSASEEHPWWETFLRAPRVSLDPTCSR